jgi:hypothetical protein
LNKSVRGEREEERAEKQNRPKFHSKRLLSRITASIPFHTLLLRRTLSTLSTLSTPSPAAVFGFVRGPDNLNQITTFKLSLIDTERTAGMNSNSEEQPSVEDPIKYLPITSPQTLQLCSSRNVHDSAMPNIFIASYPKSGTTWMQAIVYALLSNGNDDFEHISNFSPFYEIDPHWEVADDGTGSFAAKFAPFHAEIGHHVFNTHLRLGHYIHDMLLCDTDCWLHHCSRSKFISF